MTVEADVHLRATDANAGDEWGDDWVLGQRRQATKTPAVSADFQHALMQEVMTTELLRIKALIATAAVLGVIVTIVYLFATEAVSRVWHGNLTPVYLYSIIGPFILFECGCTASSSGT